MPCTPRTLRSRVVLSACVADGMTDLGRWLMKHCSAIRLPTEYPVHGHVLCRLLRRTVSSGTKSRITTQEAHQRASERKYVPRTEQYAPQYGGLEWKRYVTPKKFTGYKAFISSCTIIHPVPVLRLDRGAPHPRPREVDPHTSNPLASDKGSERP